MRRTFLTVVFFITACCTAQSSAIDRYSVRDAVRRNVIIVAHRPDGGVSECSGFVVETGLVATAKHCAGQDMTANGVAAQPASNSTDDVLLLSVHTPDAPRLQMTSDVAAGDQVFGVVSHDPWPDLVTIGHVIAVTKDGIFCSVLAAPGISGGALYNARGQLVGILTQIIGAHYGPEGVYNEVLFASAVPVAALVKLLPRQPLPIPDATRRNP